MLVRIFQEGDQIFGLERQFLIRQTAGAVLSVSFSRRTESVLGPFRHGLLGLEPSLLLQYLHHGLHTDRGDLAFKFLPKSEENWDCRDGS